MSKQAVRVSLVLFLSLLLMAGFGHGQEQAYIIGPDDVLSVVIFAEGKSQEALTLNVSSEGNINFPFLGNIKAAGLSIPQLTDVVTQPLAMDYFVNPQVIINIKNYKSKKVYITGAIGNPGLYPLEQGTTTLLELIAKAGGVTKDRSNFAHVLRGSIEDVAANKNIGDLVEQKKSIRVDLRELLAHGGSERNLELQAGDVVYIPPTSFSDLTEHKIYVLGKVSKPGLYDFQEGLTALDACILAGGFAKYAAPNRTTITRRGAADSKQKIIKINLNKIREGDAEDIQLKPGDRIFVPESWL